MKKLLLAVLMLGILSGCTSSNVEFPHNSFRLHLPGEAGQESVDIPYYGEAEDIELIGIKDYSSNVKVDPNYVIDYKKSTLSNNGYYILDVLIPMFEDMKVEFSTITYKLNKEEKEADIGVFEIEKSGLGLREHAIEEMGNEEENKFSIDLNTEQFGTLKKVEATNPDVRLETNIQKINTEEADTRITADYRLSKEYDFVTTNFCYTFEKEGKESVVYGLGQVKFAKNYDIVWAGDFNRAILNNY